MDDSLNREIFEKYAASFKGITHFDFKSISNGINDQSKNEIPKIKRGRPRSQFKKPIISISAKMVPETYEIYIKVVKLINLKGRAGPGKILKYLLHYYLQEEKKKNEISLHIATYLGNLKTEIENGAYDFTHNRLSQKAKDILKNIDNYIAITKIEKETVRIILNKKEPQLVSIFDLYIAVRLISK